MVFVIINLTNKTDKKEVDTMLDITYIANTIRKTIIARNPDTADRIGKTETFNNSYSTEAHFTMKTKTGGKVEVVFIVDRNSEYTKFVTVQYSLYDNEDKRVGAKIFHYSFDMYERNVFGRILNEIKVDLKLT